uniref:OTU domain-containing protein n=1 Tax=Glossina brevipalpis TaxID=37001 RepID=A0A1A9W929_9MUSC
MEREFSSGSRQAPDPIDQFLEGHNYYRKHIARDASCLFRVISEQIYDSQLHHLAIRAKCISYMRKHWQFFERFVERDFNEYLNDMSKPKTCGTLLELQAAGHLFQRNILLFEPFNLGNELNEYCLCYDGMLRVFCTPEKHFDSIFTADYIREAAICQSICYEIIYKNLFKLPDITFAIEKMLHGNGFENIERFTHNAEDEYTANMSLADGRFFQFDLPHNTNCILENYKYCHFHYSNFPRFSQNLLCQIKQGRHGGEHENSLFIRTSITPFPYKVAKALDSNMYRNIEFDTWSEIRKEMKLQNWYNGDSNFKLVRYRTKPVRKIFQVGAKCLVKLCQSGEVTYTCHIQEMPIDKGYCVVYIEQVGERRLVPYECLIPLPRDQFKPWSLPYRFQRQMKKYNSLRLTRHYSYPFKVDRYTRQRLCEGFNNENDFKNELTYKDNLSVENDKILQRQLSNTKHRLDQYTHLENFRAQTMEYCTMPLTVNMKNKPSNQSDLPRAPTYPSSCQIPMEPEDETAGENSLAVAPASNTGGCEFEQAGAANSVYTSDVQSFYHPLQTYNGMLPEDYPSYNYECNLPPVPIHPPPFVSIVNGAPGSLYYVCNSAGNVYMPPPPLNMQSSMLPPPAAPGVLLPSNSYLNSTSAFQNSAVSQEACTAKINQLVENYQSIYDRTQSNIGMKHNNNFTNNSTINYRINYDAKRSVKKDGIDLPTDIATLRYFYNLGIDHYHKYLKRNNSVNLEFKPRVNKMQVELKNSKPLEKINQAIEANKADPNNNMIYSNNSNSDKNNGKLNQQRRFIPRYFNNRDRQGGGNAPSNRSTAKQSLFCLDNSLRDQSNSNSSKNSSASSVQNAPVQAATNFIQDPKQHTQQVTRPSVNDQSSMMIGFDSNSATEFGVENCNKTGYNNGQGNPGAFSFNNEQYGENRSVYNYFPSTSPGGRSFLKTPMAAPHYSFQIPVNGTNSSVIANSDEHNGSPLSNISGSLPPTSENINLQSSYPLPALPMLYPPCAMPTSLNTANPRSIPFDGGLNIPNGPNLMTPHHSQLTHMGVPQGYWCLPPPPPQTPFQPNAVPLLSGVVANMNLTAETQGSVVNVNRNKSYENSTKN